MSERKEINRIKVILESQGRSQSWLAKQLGCTKTTVNFWCNNRNQPYLADILRIAEVLEVAPADLIIDGSKKEKGLTERQTL